MKLNVSTQKACSRYADKLEGLQAGGERVVIVERIASTVGWTVLAVLMFYGGIRLFDLIDPIDYRAEIRKGNVAAGMIMAGLIVAIAAIIIAVMIVP